MRCSLTITKKSHIGKMLAYRNRITHRKLCKSEAAKGLSQRLVKKMSIWPQLLGEGQKVT